MRIPKAKVPLHARRKAAQHLESLRGTPMGEGLDQAKLADEVTPMYRADVDGVAYYEFLLDRKDAQQRRGFVVISAGPHDFPHAHWSLDRAPISDELAAAAKTHGKAVARIYKADVLGYVAESDDGEETARSGELPVPAVVAQGAEAQIVTAIAEPSTTAPDARGGNQSKHTLKKSSDKKALQIRRDIPSWGALKKEYAKAFAVPLGHLKNRASKAWEIEELIDKFGEGIFVGKPLRVALLEADAKYDVTGAGATAVELRRID
jgi:hypothetical protein